ncbi:MAG TPA: Maf family protein [Anaerovoracaceae bacterium]|nr:Maf family protein [Anaerovoracaceae bacterium]
MDSRIILASSSPRRIEMMKKNGIDPIIIPSSVDENCPLELTMGQAVMFLALKKALNVENSLLTEQGGIRGKSETASAAQARIQPPSVIIAADTVVYKDGIIGKPSDRTDAVDTLKLLRDTSHFVATGVAMVRPGEPKRSIFYDVTEVFFKDYSDEEIQNYVDTDEPWDKAGSYAIQGAWGRHVSHINGSYDNVIGFPWERIQKELQKNWPEINL